MKKYLILTPNVCGMGGAELYTLRRCTHLKKEGFDVHVMVAYHKDYFPLKEEFGNTPIHLFPEINMYVAGVPNTRAINVVDEMIKIADCHEGALIESHTLFAAEWGELLAYYCKGKHLIYALTEHKVSGYRFEPGRSIFGYKCKRGEFFGCFSSALSRIFDRNDIPDNYVNVGFDDSELVEKSSPALHIKKGLDEYVITTVGRLEKVYVEPFINNTIAFAKKHAERNFMLVIGGGSQLEGYEERIRKEYQQKAESIPNIRIVFTGYIEKLGKDLFDFTNVFVGLGTATINSISQGCLTINVDPSSKNMERVSGFFGTDTKNFAYSDNGVTYSLEEKLEEALFADADKSNKMKEAGLKTYNDCFKSEVCMQRLDNIFNTIKVADNGNIIRIPFYYRLYVIIGLKIYYTISNMFHYKC